MTLDNIHRKPIKAWAYYGKKHLKGKLLHVSLEKPYDHVLKDWTEVEIRPIKKGKKP